MMICEEVVRSALGTTLKQTDWTEFGELRRGKVRDNYIKGDRRAIVVSDRLSAFDHIVATIPFKGQILNGLSVFWFKKTEALCPNHLITVPDPAVSIVRECRPFPLEMVVRRYLTGSSPTSIWTHYEAGARSYAGHCLADGLSKHDRFASPLLTPTTKGEEGAHDEIRSRSQCIAQGLVSEAEFEELSVLSLKLFSLGERIATERGMLLVDTKYEFGRTSEGEIIVIDEIHTPDSSRYWYADSYEKALSRGADPRALDKEYVRRYLGDLGYRGEGTKPRLPDSVRIEATRRYAEIFEELTGEAFVPDLQDPQERIESNLRRSF